MDKVLKMGLRQWIHKITAPKNPNQGVLTDEMREQALAMRRLQHNAKQAEKLVELQQKIEALSNISNPKATVEEQLLTQLLTTILPLLVAKFQNQDGAASPLTSLDTNNSGYAPSVLELSDKDIINLLNQNPKLVQHADKFSDEQIKEYLMQQMPYIGKKSVEKVIIEVRNHGKV